MQQISAVKPATPQITRAGRVGGFAPAGGGRVSSPKLRRCLSMAEDFAGLEEDVNRYDLLLLVKRTGKSFGFSARMIELLDYYMSFTREIDWEQGAQPIVYQSLSRTALDLGVSERQIQKLENALFEVGAISWNDSGNHRRYGQRCPETGAILYAYGVDLTPLAYLKGTLAIHLEQKRRYDAAWMETKRQISWYRRQIRGAVAELVAIAGEEEAAACESTYNDLAVQIRTHMDLECLESLLIEHKALHQHLLEGLEEQIKGRGADVINTPEPLNSDQLSDKDTCEGEQKGAYYIDTTQKQFNKLNHSRRIVRGFRESGNEIPLPRDQDSGQRGDSASSKPEILEKPEALNPILATGLQHITLKQALNGASERFKAHMPLEPRPMNWNDFVEAAYALKTELKISQTSWANACVTLGRSGAAICLLLTDQAAQREENRVLKPGAYFNAMIGRAKKGELHLHNSIFAILKRREGEENLSF
ncbi:MAG: plasmid replication protein RepC [Micavibrio sp.]